MVGPGSIGLLCLQVALAEGGRAVVVGRREDRKRLELALRLGAERVVVVEEEDVEAVRSPSCRAGTEPTSFSSARGIRPVPPCP